MKNHVERSQLTRFDAWVNSDQVMDLKTGFMAIRMVAPGKFVHAPTIWKKLR